MSAFPTASVVSRALRRDVGITTRSATEYGFSTHGGWGAPTIRVSVSDSTATNHRRAVELAENLRDVFGWDVKIPEEGLGGGIIYVHAVPSKGDAALAAARYQTREDAETKRRIATAELTNDMPAVVADNLSFLG